MEDADRGLPLAEGTTGPMFAQALAYAVMGLALLVTGLVFMAEVPSHRPNPCEAGRVGAAGVAVAFFCAGIALARPALHDVAAAVRGRRAGNVALIGSSLVLDVPGLLREPCAIAREWIEEVVLVEGAGRSDVRPVVGGGIADLKFSMTKPAAFLVLKSPVQLGQAAYVPRVFQRFAPVQPSPWAPIGIVAVEPAFPAVFVQKLQTWLVSTPESPSPPSPPRVERSYRRLALFLVPVATGLGAFALFAMSVPSDC